MRKRIVNYWRGIKTQPRMIADVADMIEAGTGSRIINEIRANTAVSLHCGKPPEWARIIETLFPQSGPNRPSPKFQKV